MWWFTSSHTSLHIFSCYLTQPLHPQECMLNFLCFPLKLYISVNIQIICLWFVLSCWSRWVDDPYVVSCMYYMFVMVLRWHMQGNKDQESDLRKIYTNMCSSSQFCVDGINAHNAGLYCILSQHNVLFLSFSLVL